MQFVILAHENSPRQYEGTKTEPNIPYFIFKQTESKKRICGYYSKNFRLVNKKRPEAWTLHFAVPDHFRANFNYFSTFFNRRINV